MLQWRGIVRQIRTREFGSKETYMIRWVIVVLICFGVLLGRSDSVVAAELHSAIDDTVQWLDRWLRTRKLD
jgi:hypothetical protein